MTNVGLVETTKLLENGGLKACGKCPGREGLPYLDQGINGGEVFVECVPVKFFSPKGDSILIPADDLDDHKDCELYNAYCEVRAKEGIHNTA